MALGDCCTCNFVDTTTIQSACPANYAPFMTFLSLLISAKCDLSDACKRIGKDPTEEALEKSYDFIIVGSGVSGPIVASRLAENPDWKILIIEAGPEAPSGTSLPNLALNSVGSSVDWNITTVAQKSACLSSGGKCAWPRGKMVGGTQGMQGMMYMRGSPEIYNSWEDLGNPGWGFDDVLPYFKKSENNLNIEDMEADYHGTDGPLVVQYYSDHPVLAEDVVKAGVQLGYQTGDLNGKNQSGFTIAQMMVYENQRGSTDRMYLRINQEKRPNLRLAINAHVTKVLVTNKVATGVEFIDKNGKKQTVQASKEVILSAGTIGSAQILLLSGIGPKKDLEALGITSVSDIPVGANLHNHVSIGVPFNTNIEEKNLLNYNTINQYLTSRSGPLTSTGMTQLTAFLISKFSADKLPDIQVFFDGLMGKCSKTGDPNECSNGEIKDKCDTLVVNTRPTNLRPTSRGSLKLKSTDPLEQPLLDPNYFGNQEDLDTLIDGIKIVIKMTQQDALKQYAFTPLKPNSPACDNLEFGSDEYWGCYIKQETGPENHQVGTCSMGPTPDKFVVNNELKVHGVDHLRVIDASIMPLNVNANPIGVIAMIGEKGADLIKNSWTSKIQQPRTVHPRFAQI